MIRKELKDLPAHIQLLLKDRSVLLAIDFHRYPEHALVVRCLRPDTTLIDPFVETFWVDKNNIGKRTDVSDWAARPVVTKTDDKLKFEFRVDILNSFFSGVILCCQNKKKDNKLKYFDPSEPNISHHLQYVYCDDTQHRALFVCRDTTGYYQRYRYL